MTSHPHPALYELAGNFHLHTNHSDGAGTHRQVAEAAAQADLDVIFYTDHNVWTPDQEGWYVHPKTGHKTLLLMGEEVHDPSQSPERNHLLCLGADRSLSHYAPEPQALVTAVTRHGGIGFIAHPIERAAPLYNEPALPWTHWDVSGFAGIELWNYMSEFKAYLWSKSAAIFAAFFPCMVISGPFPEALALWDNLLRDGRKIVAIGNADAHANVYRLGPLQRAVFAYEHLFKAVNTHLLLSAPLSTDVASAKAQVLNALWAGHAFVAYDLIGSSKGFRFTATTGRHSAWMGDEIHLDGGPISLHVTSPLTATLRLLKDGRLVAKKRGKELTFQANTAGVYRVEAYRSYWFKLRGWIFANPIYVRD